MNHLIIDSQSTFRDFMKLGIVDVLHRGLSEIKCCGHGGVIFFFFFLSTGSTRTPGNGYPRYHKVRFLTKLIVFHHLARICHNCNKFYILLREELRARFSAVEYTTQVDILQMSVNMRLLSVPCRYKQRTLLAHKAVSIHLCGYASSSPRCVLRRPVRNFSTKVKLHRCQR